MRLRRPTSWPHPFEMGDGVEIFYWVLTLHVDLDAVNIVQLANLAAPDGLTGGSGIINAPAS
jgi:hypothetical protein